jgi:hypothetical protein
MGFVVIFGGKPEKHIINNEAIKSVAALPQTLPAFFTVALKSLSFIVKYYHLSDAFSLYSPTLF